MKSVRRKRYNKPKDSSKDSVSLPSILNNEIKDAETGEAISLIRKKWDSVEGVKTVRSFAASELGSELLSYGYSSSLESLSIDEQNYSEPFVEKKNPLFLEFMAREESHRHNHLPSPNLHTLGSASSASSLGSEISSNSGGKYANRSLSRSPSLHDDRSSISPGTNLSSSRSLSPSRGSSRRRYRETSDTERKLRGVYFKELMTEGRRLISDPRWKLSESHFQTEHELKKMARRIADLMSAEEKKEKDRQTLERSVRSLPSRLALVQRQHSDERRRFRAYVERLQYENEIVLFTRMKESGFLCSSTRRALNISPEILGIITPGHSSTQFCISDSSKQNQDCVLVLCLC
eukprot:gene4953-9907_t